MYSRDYREKAWSQLKGRYWTLFVIGLIVAAVMGSSAAVIGIILTGPLMIGVNRYALLIVRKNEDDTNLLVSPFKESVIDYIITYILKNVFIFLWTLLLIIPGIIKAFAYSMTYFILADNPELKAQEAIKASEELMRGQKWRLFKLYFSFIGWYILAALTFGIGYLFLQPYVHLAVANFYEDIKA